MISDSSIKKDGQQNKLVIHRWCETGYRYRIDAFSWPIGSYWIQSAMWYERNINVKFMTRCPTVFGLFLG